MAHASVGQLWSLQLFVSPMLGRKEPGDPRGSQPREGAWGVGTTLPCGVGLGSRESCTEGGAHRTSRAGLEADWQVSTGRCPLAH